MNAIDEIPTIKGHWRLDVFDGDREIDPNTGLCVVTRPLEVIEGENLVTTVGKGLLLDRLYGLGGPPAAISATGVGTGSTAAAAGDTQLTAGAVLQAFDSAATRSGLVVTSVTTFATGVANFAWAELGLFNGTVNGTSLMLNHIAPIGPFTKSAAVSIAVTVTLTQS